MEILRKQFAQLFDLPAEIILDFPLIMLVGQQKIYIENHKGIARYDQEEVVIRLKKGYLHLSGQRLTIEEIRVDSLLVSGWIEGINYDK